jgi:hypothetical protein
MELRKTATIIALRSVIRLAWGMERAARALGGIGLWLEGAVEQQARQRQVDIDEVLGPLVADAIV